MNLGLDRSLSKMPLAASRNRDEIRHTSFDLTKRDSPRAPNVSILAGDNDMSDGSRGNMLGATIAECDRIQTRK
jgi:hypothetical protein